jgi:hypothetical protein
VFSQAPGQTIAFGLESTVTDTVIVVGERGGFWSLLSMIAKRVL